ncbi:MAG: tetratricopeptide repeat protein [Spirochaetaceae bacterium]|nr:tetratricopeptide repeat protein [Spirochaetaceae bacterium]
MKNKTESKHNIVRRKSKLIPRLILCASVLLVSVLVAIPLIYFINSVKNSSISISDIYKNWEATNYQEVYDMTGVLLKKKPLHNTALTFRGYAGFYLADAQTDSIQAQSFLDEAIINMRVSLNSAPKNTKAQLQYMLGKSYYYKNVLSAYHYYSDLAIKYLNLAKANGYNADDIPEYLGLCYASLDMTQESIAAFTEALLVRESDILLLSIAKQYYKNGQVSAAKAYLHRVSTDTKDDTLRFESSALLGQIYLEEENYDDAKKEFETILEKDINNADAYYGLGVIYEKQGELVKARAEWRKALRIDVNHQNALKKMAEYK